MPAPRLWTEEEDNKLRELAAEKMSYSQIAAELGRKKNAIIGRAHRIGVTNNRRIGFNGPIKRKPIERKPVLLSSAATPVEVVADGGAAAPVTLAKSEFVMPAWKCHGEPAVMALTSQTCRWPVGDPREKGFRFCLAESGGALYCAHHHAIAFSPVRRSYG